MREIDSLKGVRGEEGKAHLDLFLLTDGRSLPLLTSGSLVKGKMTFGHKYGTLNFSKEQLNSSSVRLLYLI